MSMLLMVKAMQSKVGNPLRKLVLIKLADNANDQGECWPSYQHIADQCEMSKRSVMIHIDALIQNGFLRKELRVGGEKGNKSNLYTLRIPSAGDSLPSSNAAPPSEGDSPPPSAADAPRTSHYIEPIMEPYLMKIGKEVVNFSSWPNLPSEQVFNDWVKMRKAKKAQITQTVISKMGKELVKAASAGISVDDCLEECVTSNWQGFQASWIIKRREENGYQTNTRLSKHDQLTQWSLSTTERLERELNALREQENIGNCDDGQQGYLPNFSDVDS